MVVNTQGGRVARFASEYVRLFEGRWAGCPLELEDFQRQIVDEVFRTDKHGKRIYKRVLLGLPRKNAKSHLAALLGLYLLIADGENAPQVLLAAGAREQAKEILYKQAKTFVETSPYLPDYIDVQERRLYCADNRGLIRAISAEGKSAHGFNPYAALVDEMWTLSSPKQREMWSALNTGSLAREAPFVIAITTAGFDKNTPLGEFYDQMMKAPDIDTSVPGRTIARNMDAGELMIWYGAPDGCDLDDEEAWMLANPASWITVEALRAERESSALNEADFRRLYLNQWTAAAGTWLTHGMWDACEGKVIWEPGQEVWFGLDVAAKHDRTALVMAGQTDDGVQVESFIFEAGESETPMRLRAKMKLQELGAIYSVREVAYDSWGLDAATAAEWEIEGIPMVEFPQTHARMCPATQTTYSMVKDLRLTHNGDRVLAQHVAAAVSVRVERGWRLTKKNSTQPNDGSIALVMAVSRASVAEPVAEFWVL